jgi:hypothetical protein
MNAIAVALDGTPLGICGQVFWARPEKPSKASKAAKRARPMREKETRYWFEAMHQVMAAFLISGTRSVPWFQIDRAGDFNELLAWAADHNANVTVRACQDRRLETDEATYLWDHIEQQPSLGTCMVDVPGGHGRTPRQATLEVRAVPVTIRLKNRQSGVKRPAHLYAVQTLEVDGPEGEEPLSWTLLTNVKVTTLDEAKLVVFGYSLRWRVEEFHKTWKSVCKVESTQITEGNRIIKWAVILAAVAMRIERVKYLARTHPDQPATSELCREEIDATIHLRQPKGYKPGDSPSIGKVIGWIADLGGYTGKSSGGPPGAIVLARGLSYIASAVQLLKLMKEK